MRLVSGVFGFGQPWLILRRYTGLAADHGADHQRFRVDGCPAGQVGADLVANHADRRGVQLADAEARSGQRRNLSAGAVSPFLPHNDSLSPSRPTSIPRILGSSRPGGQPSVDGMTHLVQHTAAGEGAELTAPEEAAQEIQQVLGRHDVTVAGLEAVR